jgi:hypothetical protein
LGSSSLVGAAAEPGVADVAPADAGAGKEVAGVLAAGDFRA